MVIEVIRTPLDFERTLDAPVYRVNQWNLPLPPEEEAEIQGVVTQVFAGREQAGTSDEPDSIASYLDAIAEPLAALQARGLQVVAVLTRGSCVIPNFRGRRAIASVDVADYLVAPDPCFFRPTSDDFAEPIHKLGADCPDGHTTIVGDSAVTIEKVFSIWTSREFLRQDFELTVPWCPRCRQNDAIDEAAAS
jgi:hypothetical protein